MASGSNVGDVPVEELHQQAMARGSKMDDVPVEKLDPADMASDSNAGYVSGEELDPANMASYSNAGDVSGEIHPAVVTSRTNMRDVPVEELNPWKFFGDRWITSVQRTVTPNTCIPRVPANLREIESNKKHFEPVVVSLGPYHHGKPHLQRMQRYKISALKHYINGFGHFRLYYPPFKKEAVKHKKRYQWEQDIPSDEEFAWMMFMDTCFLLDFIHVLLSMKDHSESNNSSDDKSPSDLSLTINDMVDMLRDIMLQENQLPLVFLTKLISIRNKVGVAGGTSQQEQQPPPQPMDIINKFIALLSESINPSHHSKSHQENQDIDEDKCEPVHLLHCFRRRFLGKRLTQTHSQVLPSIIRGSFNFGTVSELKEAGIKVRRSGSCYLRDVGFTSGLFSRIVLLPSIFIDCHSRWILLNMMGYEMGEGGPPIREITNFAYLMDNLIDSKEDVKELKSKDILRHFFGDDQKVTDFFNSLTSGAVANYDAYADLRHFIDSCHKSRCRVSFANLYHTRFSSPWTTVAFLAAVFLILLTMIQTYFAVFPRK